uniref:Uncharacterized protein n=1 Tax=Falco tinnunculus TaxID=100819 RepID=A0A8C4TXR1_FALTI
MRVLPGACGRKAPLALRQLPACVPLGLDTNRPVGPRGAGLRSRGKEGEAGFGGAPAACVELRIGAGRVGAGGSSPCREVRIGSRGSRGTSGSGRCCPGPAGEIRPREGVVRGSRGGSAAPGGWGAGAGGCGAESRCPRSPRPASGAAPPAAQRRDPRRALT